jgi:hypothetical protein
MPSYILMLGYWLDRLFSLASKNFKVFAKRPRAPDVLVEFTEPLTFDEGANVR